MDDSIARLNHAQIERYARQLVLPEIGADGQLKLLNSHMAIIGCGGLGADAALTLAQAGVGQLELYDADRVEVSNLHRQPFTTDQIGQPKAEALEHLCQARNPEVEVAAQTREFRGAPAPIWLDCTDSPTSRRAIEARRGKDTTLVFGSVLGMDAQVTVFLSGKPGFSSLFPPLPDASRTSCADQGVLGPLASMTAQIMASEAMKLAMGQPSSLADALLLIDARDWRVHQIKR